MWGNVRIPLPLEPKGKYHFRIFAKISFLHFREIFIFAKMKMFDKQNFAKMWILKFVDFCKNAKIMQKWDDFFSKIDANCGIIIDVQYLGNGASDWILFIEVGIFKIK
jgi:hypothetical protein